jgi:flagellar motility protein MotE (MotC chaperone)
LVPAVGLLLVTAPSASAGEQEELLQELRALKERIEQLEAKINGEGKSLSNHRDSQVIINNDEGGRA